MLISVHLPKTAGTSISEVLQKSFGDAYVKDYSDMPINTPPVQRKRHAFEFALDQNEESLRDVRCIHGHFLPLKYLLLAEVSNIKFVTWLREPVDRLLSHYHFWLRSYNAQNSGGLHRRVVEEGWTLEKFCFSEELRNLYNQFLFGFPLEYFSFIGIMENFDQDFEYFKARYLGLDVKANRLNERSGAENSYQVDLEFRKAVEEFHSDDVALYQRAVRLRELRLQD